jgi:hypothetical protein
MLLVTYLNVKYTLHYIRSFTVSDKNLESSGWEARNIKNTRHLGYWTVAWLATIALTAFGPEFLWQFNASLTLVGLFFTLVTGTGMIISTTRQVKGLDEMQQKIFLDASALALGVALVCGTSYELMEDIKLISFQPEISHLLILISLTFMAGIAVGNLRFR